MGVDIHMRLIKKDGTLIARNLYDGRATEWFDSLCGRGYDFSSVYKVLQNYIKHGLPENALKSDIADKYGYNHRHISLEDYLNWYMECKPNIDAAWFTTYEKWKMENKKWLPDMDNLKYFLDAEDNPADYHFMEIANYYCPDSEVVRQITKVVPENEPLNDYIIYFYFDR